MTELEELRAWASRCADVTRGRMAEYSIWEAIAEEGQEWKPRLTKAGKLYRAGRRMEATYCFYNSAATVLGEVAGSVPAGLRYAEGFALSSMGLWFHHAWCVMPDGLVLDRTWDQPGQRYVGVIIDKLTLEPGDTYLAPIACGIPWGQNYESTPEIADWLFNDKESDEHTGVPGMAAQAEQRDQVPVD